MEIKHNVCSVRHQQTFLPPSKALSFILLNFFKEPWEVNDHTIACKNTLQVMIVNTTTKIEGTPDPQLTKPATVPFIMKYHRYRKL